MSKAQLSQACRFAAPFLQTNCKHSRLKRLLRIAAGAKQV